MLSIAEMVQAGRFEKGELYCVRPEAQGGSSGVSSIYSWLSRIAAIEIGYMVEKSAMRS
jgi:hypothetical protein